MVVKMFPCLIENLLSKSWLEPLDINISARWYSWPCKTPAAYAHIQVCIACFNAFSLFPGYWLVCLEVQVPPRMIKFHKFSASVECQDCFKAGWRIFGIATTKSHFIVLCEHFFWTRGKSFCKNWPQLNCVWQCETPAWLANTHWIPSPVV